MKIYNPFKAHIVQFRDGTFAIRKSYLFCFGYLGSEPNYYWWFNRIYYKKLCIFNNYEDCKKRYLEYIKYEDTKTKFIEQ